MIDNKKLQNNFKSGNYLYCVNILRKEIIQKLINNITKFKPEYKYTNLIDLKMNCYKYLNDKEKNYITSICRYAEEEYPIITELNDLLNIYSTYK